MDTERIQVIPQGYENLACSYAKPAAWKTADIPPQAFDNEDPYFFLPLVAAVSPDGAGAFTVGARPAYPDGTLIEADGMRGLLFDGRQPGDTADFLMRNLYIEDGGVLYAVAAMALEPYFEAIEPWLTAMTTSFRPAEINGPTVELDTVPDTAFPSQLLSAALPIPAHWSATEDAATTTITQQPDQAIVIQIDRRPVDQTLLDTLHAAHPGANSMRNTEDGVEVLLLAGLDEPFPFRAYFVRPRPQSSEMFVVEVNFRDGFMQQAIPAARNIHLALAES
jgi:hypothetical protein